MNYANPLVTIDEEFRALIPPASKADLEQLERNLLRAGGATEALIEWNGIVLDGHTRYQFCQKHALPFKTKPAEPWIKTRDDATLWILENQEGRRNMSKYDRIIVRDRKAELLRKRAAENRAAGLAKSPKGGGPIGSDQLIKTDNRLDVRAAIAKAAGTSEGTVYRAQQVHRHGAPELVEAVRTGEVPFKVGADLAKKPKHEQPEAIDRWKKEKAERKRVEIAQSSARTELDDVVRAALDGGLTTKAAAKQLGCSTSAVAGAKKRLGMTRGYDSPAAALTQISASLSLTLSQSSAPSWVAKLISKSTDEEVLALVEALSTVRKTARAMVSEINAQRGQRS